jgi:ribosomal protein S12 methylthiotransferase
MSAPLSVHFVTLGCPKNEVDSDHMAAAVTSSAYRLTDDLETADVAIVNTCAFIADATEESVETVLTLAAEWKAARPGRFLVVSGCLVSRYGDELPQTMPEVDAFVPVANEEQLLELIEGLTGLPAEASDGPGRTPSGPSAYLQVADGCFRRCAFCTIPFIRGGYRSRPIDDLAAEARLLAASGARELVLVGQDTSGYGHELGDGAPTLSDVVRAVAAAEGIDWVRLMYVQPDGITPELLETMAELPNVVRYLDIPFQHASASVLHAMNRTGSGDEFLRLIKVVRELLPGVVLRTSLIAGFPGETDADIEVLEDFLLAAQLDYAGVFTYSPEEGTAAVDLPGQLPEEVRLERTQRVRDTADRIGFERAAAHVGETLEVLIEGEEDGDVVGRWRGQAPDVDGVVLLDAAPPAGSLVRAHITGALAYDLVAEVVS